MLTKTILPVFGLLLVLLFIPVQSSNLPGSNISTDTIIIDGIVDNGEYESSIILDAGKNFILYFSANSTTVHFALQADVLGYLSVGFGSTMLAADFVIGYVNSTATAVKDAYGDSSTSIALDTEDNILASAGTETATTTTLEFARKLDTNDATQDVVLNLDTPIDIIWGYHNTNDDFSTYHSGRGYAVLNILSTPVASAPLNLTASVDKTAVTLNWQPPEATSGILGYNVYHSTVSGSTYSLILENSNVLTFTHNDTVPGAKNYYTVAAITDAGVGYNSTEVMVKISPLPIPLKLVTISSGDAKIAITWKDTANKENVTYQIFRLSPEDIEYDNIANTTSNGYIDEDVKNDKEYFYYVVVSNELGGSNASNIVRAVPRASKTLTGGSYKMDTLYPALSLIFTVVAVIIMWIIVRIVNKKQ